MDTLINTKLLSSGIYGLLDNRNIYIGYSSNMLQAVSRQLSMIKDGIHTNFINTDIDNIQVLIIETTTSNLKLRQTYWCDYYKTQGYQVLNTNRLLRYKIRTRIDINYNILVELVSQNKKSIIVGVFSNMLEAEAYCKFLQQNDPLVPIVCTSDLTSKYMKMNKKTKF